MDRALLLFDIDGTILKTGGAGMRAMFRVGERLFGPDFSWDGIVASGHLDPLIFYEAAQRNGLVDHAHHHERFRDSYLAELEAELAARRHDVEAMPGVIEVIHDLKRRTDSVGDVLLGLVTGNYSAAVPIKLGAVGLDVRWFEVTAFGDEAADRPGLVRLAMDRYEAKMGHAADPARVIIIGDTPRDVTCAKAHGCKALCVATGSYTIAELIEAGADIAVDDLADPSPLLRMIDTK